MRKFFFVMMLIMILALLGSCADGQNGADVHLGSNEVTELFDRIEDAILRNLTNNPDVEINEEGIGFFFNFDLSSEGASFLTLHDDLGRLEYLGVDIFGEMGRISHSYTFTEHFIVYSVVEIMYSEPMFMNPLDIPIANTYNSRYIIFNGRVYRFVDEGENMAIDDEYANIIIERLIYFLDVINT